MALDNAQLVVQQRNVFCEQDQRRVIFMFLCLFIEDQLCIIELEQMLAVIQRQKELGRAIGDELDLQNAMLRDVDDKVDVAGARLRGANEKIKRLN